MKKIVLNSKSNEKSIETEFQVQKLFLCRLKIQNITELLRILNLHHFKLIELTQKYKKQMMRTMKFVFDLWVELKRRKKTKSYC